MAWSLKYLYHVYYHQHLIFRFPWSNISIFSPLKNLHNLYNLLIIALPKQISLFLAEFQPFFDPFPLFFLLDNPI